MERNKRMIDIAHLRTIVDSIFSHIEDDLGIKEVELREDQYWDFSDQVLYLGEKKEDEITVGSLYDDLEFLEPLLHDKDQAFPLMLIHVSPLLRYLAHKIGQ